MEKKIIFKFSNCVALAGLIRRKQPLCGDNVEKASSSGISHSLAAYKLRKNLHPSQPTAPHLAACMALQLILAATVIPS